MRAQRIQLAGPRKRATSPFLSSISPPSSTLFRLLYFPRSHRTLGSNARKRPVKRSRLDRTRLDSTRLDSASTRLSTLPPERVRSEQRLGTPTSMKNVLWISRRPIGGSADSFVQWPRIVNFKRALFSPSLHSLYVLLYLYKLPSVSSRDQLSFSLFFPLLSPSSSTSRVPGQAYRPQV